MKHSHLMKLFHPTLAFTAMLVCAAALPVSSGAIPDWMDPNTVPDHNYVLTHLYGNPEPDENTFIVVLAAEGYTEEERAIFEENVWLMVNYLTGQYPWPQKYKRAWFDDSAPGRPSNFGPSPVRGREPYVRYKNFYSIWSLWTASELPWDQKRPPSESDPGGGTRFGCYIPKGVYYGVPYNYHKVVNGKKYYYGAGMGILRSLYESKYPALARRLYYLINSHAGTTTTVSMFVNKSDAYIGLAVAKEEMSGTLEHELGHWHGLADEYQYAIKWLYDWPNYVRDYNNLTWHHWIDAGVPIPSGTSSVDFRYGPQRPNGAYERVANDMTSKFYVPHKGSMMVAPVLHQGDVNLEHMILFLWTFNCGGVEIADVIAGAGSAPSCRLDGATAPNTLEAVPANHKDILSCRWSLVSEGDENDTSGTAISNDWILNVEDAVASSGLPPGRYTLVLSVYDGTEFIRKDPNGVTSDERTWSFEILTDYRGAVTVNISPTEVVNAGAQWRVGFSGVWHNSGETVVCGRNAQTIYFKGVDGWVTPAPVTITVNTGETSSASAQYELLPKPSPVATGFGNLTETAVEGTYWSDTWGTLTFANNDLDSRWAKSTELQTWIHYVNGKFWSYSLGWVSPGAHAGWLWSDSVGWVRIHSHTSTPPSGGPWVWSNTLGWLASNKGGDAKWFWSRSLSEWIQDSSGASIYSPSYGTIWLTNSPWAYTSSLGWVWFGGYSDWTWSRFGWTTSSKSGSPHWFWTGIGWIYAPGNGWVWSYSYSKWL